MDGIDIGFDEALHITISVIALSVALTLVFAGPAAAAQSPAEFIFFIAAVFVTVGSGFILHEMCHKLSAMYYGAEARFVMSVQGVALMIVTSLLGFLFALPGATYIYSDSITKKENGVISLAGPMLNIALVFLFLGLDWIAPIHQYYSFLYSPLSGFSGFGITAGVLSVWKFGATMNLWLALFNIIPAFPLDGSKVLRWKGWLWVAITLFMLALGAAIIGPAIVFTWLLIAAFMMLISKLIFG